MDRGSAKPDHKSQVPAPTNKSKSKDSPMSEEKGVKYDQTKARYDLIPFEALDQVAEVLTFGAQKYSPDNWRYVPQARDRYFAAALRHLSAWKQGEIQDPDSGLGHLSHAACCLLFLCSFEVTGGGT